MEQPTTQAGITAAARLSNDDSVGAANVAGINNSDEDFYDAGEDELSSPELSVATSTPSSKKRPSNWMFPGMFVRVLCFWAFLLV